MMKSVYELFDGLHPDLLSKRLFVIINHIKVLNLTKFSVFIIKITYGQNQIYKKARRGIRPSIKQDT